jgi:nitrite reductase/ring-hydroxylating ferredoxin subunit/DMSO/TMAO reductase YedYZ heme-binding membrane subunit
MRALGLCAFLLLNIILCIGPLARLDARFLPLLYNRRHLGVLTFLVALTHAVIAVGYYHGFGVVNPILSLLAGNTNVTSLSAFPFQLLGLGALLILFLLAATSHDFWLKNLSPGMWKRLHMLVYFAYFLLIGHISLGALQNHRGTARPALLLVGVTSVCGLHLATGIREVRRDRATRIGAPAQEMWIDAGPVAQIPPNRARVVSAPGGERIAVFKHGDTVSAVTNVCAHQNGPLGEGKVIDGCITCPWHGWQYRPTDGRSPPPFTEKIATYRVRVVAGNAQVDPRPLPAGTPVDPAPCNRSAM